MNLSDCRILRKRRRESSKPLMDDIISAELGCSDSPSPISAEPPDITNWFSSYVYESFPLCSLVKQSESELNGFSIGVDKKNLGVAVSDSTEKFAWNKDHKPMYKRTKEISDRNLCESLPSEPPDIGNWFSSYVYESPMLNTSDGLEFSVPGESECIEEIETEKETTINDKNDVCPRLFEQENVSFAKVADFSQSQSVLSEPPDVRNWFSSYEYQSPELSDTHELRFSSFEKDQLIIDESDAEEEKNSSIFRKTKSKFETIALGRLNDYKETIATDTARGVFSDNAYSDQEVEKKSSVGLLNASKKETKQESSFKHESLYFEPKQEPRFSLEVSRHIPKPQFPSKNEASLHELRPKRFQETIPVNSIPMNSNRENSPTGFREENQESIDQESDDKENVHGENTETGFVTTKKARFSEARDQCSMKKPNRGVLMGCSRSKEIKDIAEEEDEETRKKRKVLGEVSNHQFSRAEEIAGKWRCPQKNRGNSVPPLKQLRLDAWIHKL